MACRSVERAENALKEIIESTGNKDVEIYKLDLASLKSVRECAEEVNKKESRLDILINNAGTTYRPLVKSVYQKKRILISQPKHMLWILQRTVLMRRFF